MQKNSDQKTFWHLKCSFSMRILTNLLTAVKGSAAEFARRIPKYQINSSLRLFAISAFFALNPAMSRQPILKH